MKKVIVSTFSNTVDNYGQVLQYLATQVFLDRIGCEATLLRKRSTTSIKRDLRTFVNKAKSFLFGASSETTNIKKVVTEQEIRKAFFSQATLITERKEKLFPRHFEEFRQRWFRIIYCKDLIKNPPIADVYCVGSDQYWSWCSDENFLNYGAKSVKRVSIAASFGAYIPKNETEWRKLRERLAQFDLVTVRERSGIDICKQAGRYDALLVPDPTLLLDAVDYEIYEEKNKSLSDDYVFVYLLGNPSHIDMSKVYDFAKKERLNVVYVTSQGREDDYPQTPATVQEWLSYMRNAKYVMTNSFHGTAFSIIYHKPFLVFPLIKPFEKMNDRIETLLEEHRLAERMFKGSYEDIKREIAYDYSDIYLEEKRKMISTKLKAVIYGQ